MYELRGGYVITVVDYGKEFDPSLIQGGPVSLAHDFRVSKADALTVWVLTHPEGRHSDSAVEFMMEFGYVPATMHEVERLRMDPVKVEALFKEAEKHAVARGLKKPALSTIALPVLGTRCYRKNQEHYPVLHLCRHCGCSDYHLIQKGVQVMHPGWLIPAVKKDKVASAVA